MAEPAKAVRAAPAVNDDREVGARELLIGRAANELVVAVVGHVGSGTSEIAELVANLLEDIGGFETTIVKARREIEEWARINGKPVPDDRDRLETTQALQDLGDAMRAQTPDFASVGEAIAARIRVLRAEKQEIKIEGSEPVVPDGTPRAYVVDAIRHPAEVEVLRHIYQDAFVLIGVVCDEDVRITRITRKYANAGRAAAEGLMKCDAKRGPKNGQRVSDAFHMSDFFVDNSEPRLLENGEGNSDWNVNERLTRLLKIVSHSEVIRPSIAETAMHHAYSASMRSACLSRQVGAALIDDAGNVIATGTNEAPRAGGGVYGELFADEGSDHRCAFSNKFCSNTVQQNEIAKRIVENIPALRALAAEEKAAIAVQLRDTDIGDLIEFSRAVHAEMDALLSAARAGTSTVGTRLYVTTFPCHYCARHIVSAGVDEVQFIEPYPKSKALSLHKDSIETVASRWSSPSSVSLKTKVGDDDTHPKVLFRPFVGVAPRMYRRAFLKMRELKDKTTGTMDIGNPEWGTSWHLRAAGYAELEAQIANRGNRGG
jgi:deoxycytidylate deaminase